MLPMDTTAVSAQRVAHAAVARIKLSRVDDRSSPGIRADLDSAARDAAGRLVVDLSDVQLLTSAGIGMLIQVRGTCAALKGAIALCGVSEAVLDVLRVTKIDRVLAVRASPAEALEAVK
jgi:anti-sigma B factor antagonist